MRSAYPSSSAGPFAPGAGENPVTGILLMLAAMAIIPALDGIAKYLSADYSVVQLTWARYFFHLLVIAPVVLWRYGRRALVPPRPLFQLFRGGLLLASTVLFFAAIAAIPLADAIALVFVSPLIVTALSPLLLGETVRLRRWLAVIVGFAGACIVIRPGFGALQWGALFAVAAGTVYAFYSLATRKLSGSAPPLVTLAYTALLGAVATSLYVPFVWITPPLEHLALMLCMGLIAAIGHFFVISAFDHAPASLLAPYGYAEIIMASVIGFVLFGEFPDAWTWLGIAVIISSGVYIAYRERQLRQSGKFPR